MRSSHRAASAAPGTYADTIVVTLTFCCVAAIECPHGCTPRQNR